MSLLPEVRRAIHATAERQVTETASRSWHSRWSSATSTVLVIAIPAVVVVAVAAVLLTVHRSSQPTAGTPGASGKVNREEPLLRILSVLRRPQTRADLPPALVTGLRRTGPRSLNGTPDLTGVRLADVTPPGQHVFLVPYKPPTARFHDGLPIKAPVEDTLQVAVVYHGRLQDEFGGGVTAGSITQAGEIGLSGEAGTNSSQFILVVPDGVAKVTLLIPRFHRHGPTTTTKITRQVHHNVVVTQVPEKPGSAPPPTMIWYGPTGRVVRRFGKARRPRAT